MPVSFSNIRTRLFRWLSRLTLGGDWALSEPAKTRHNLRWFWFDGFFSSASDNIVVTYLTLYLLALGASRAQIGLLSSLSSLSVALVLLPGALLVERIGHRKEVTVWAGGGVARAVILFLALIPLGLKGQALIYAAMVLSVIRDVFGNVAYPAWMAIIAEIIPISGRGRYFGTRNFAMGIVGMAVTLLVGELITRTNKPAGYQIALGMAFIIGMMSTYSFAHLRVSKEPPEAPTGTSGLSLPALLRDMWKHPAFLTLAGVSALWNFSLNIAGPFFNVYLVQNLKSTATMVGFLGVVSTIASLLVQRKLGELADRWGAHRMQLISGLLIPVVPFAWVFVASPWHVVPINLLSGVLWGAYSLASFNYLLELTPADQRARYSALFQLMMTLALAAGAAVGSIIISSSLAYKGVFIGSAVGRFTAAVLFARFVRGPKHSQIVPAQTAV